MKSVRNLSIFLLLMGVLTACSSSSSSSSTQPEPTPSTTTTPSTTIGQDVKLFFVGDTPRGFRLFPEVQTIKSNGDLTKSVMSSLVSGTLKPLDPDYQNLWGNGSKFNSIRVDNGVATIDLALVKLSVGSEGELRAIDQLVWTASETNPTIKGVKFTVDGKTVESFAGHVDTRGTFKRQLGYEVLNPVSIISPAQGAVLKNPIVVTGEACTFEANVAWELLKDGKSIDKGSTLAQTACPDRSSWKLDVANLASGSYTIIAREHSAKDGSVTAIDSKDFKVG
jgi:hypothetical protein